MTFFTFWGIAGTVVATAFVFFFGVRVGRKRLLAEQGREAEEIWQNVKAELAAGEAKVLELCALLGPRQCEGVE